MLPADRTVYLAIQPVDMRKSIDALSLMVSGHFKKNPGDGAFYVFSNLGRDKLKVLYWDTNGFCLWYTRLEKGRFHWPTKSGSMTLLNRRELDWLLAGLDLKKLHPHPSINYENFG